MGWRKVAFVGLLVVPLAVLAWWLASQPEGPVFRGKTAAQWERVITNWPFDYIKARDGSTIAFHWAPRSILDRVLWESGVTFAVTDPGYPLFKGDPAAVPVLLELIKSPDATTRWAAVHGLGRVGPAALVGIGALREATHDSDDMVCFAAWVELGELARRGRSTPGIPP
jgi:hypothetical protein